MQMISNIIDTKYSENYFVYLRNPSGIDYQNYVGLPIFYLSFYASFALCRASVGDLVIDHTANDQYCNNYDNR